MFDRLGRPILRLRWVIVGAWVAAAILFGVFGPSLTQVGSADESSFLPQDAESLAARHVIAESFPSDSAPSQALIVFSRAGGLTDADRTAIEGLRGYFEGSGHPDAILRYVTPENTPSLASMLRSSDNVVELARFDMSSPSFLPQTNDTIDAVRAHLASSGALPGGLVAQVSGQAGIGRDYLQAIRDGTDRTTVVTILLVVVVLLLIYRAPLAALVPLMTIGASFLVARGTLGFMAQAGWQLSSVLDSFIVVLVFGVGTDYTIFMISRFREELGRHEPDDAVRVTIGRIGAVITASAATVIVGLTSMVVARFGMIQTTGPALAITIFVTLLAGLTLTPSLLSVAGRRLFWPIQERTRTANDENRGFWAALARRITSRPGLLAGAVLVILFVPALGLPQLKQNFDVLNELPAAAESRQGFETLSRHLAQGELMPLTALIRVPSGSAADLTNQDGLARIAALEQSIAALPNVRTVRSIVDPIGEGKVSDLLRPSVQLTQTADAFRKPPSADINVQLGDASLAGIESANSYVGGLGDAFPDERRASAWIAATTDMATLHQGLIDTRAHALVVNQLDAIAKQLQAGASVPTPTDAATQLAQLGAYLDELGAAQPAIKQLASYQSASTAAAALATNQSALTVLQLLGSLNDLSGWFAAQPEPIFFAPASIKPDAATVAEQEAMAAARLRLPDELDQLAAELGSSVLYAPPSLRAAYVSAAGDVTRLYVTTATDPYDTRSFDAVRALRQVLTSDPAITSMPTDGAGAAQTYLGGATAEFADVQDTISADFLRVAAITIIGILIVLILLLRAIVAPVYLVLTVLLSYATSLGLSTVILQNVFGQPGMNYFIPLMVFVLLVALGSDYNIFLMSRVREESSNRPLRQGIRVASARTGTVITSAGLILAGTFGALVSSPLQLLFQVGLAVALGVLIDTFVVRSLLVPAITAFIGEKAWWPWHRRKSEPGEGDSAG